MNFAWVVFSLSFLSFCVSRYFAVRLPRDHVIQAGASVKNLNLKIVEMKNFCDSLALNASSVYIGISLTLCQAVVGRKLETCDRLLFENLHFASFVSEYFRFWCAPFNGTELRSHRSRSHRSRCPVFARANISTVRSGISSYFISLGNCDGYN